MSDTDVSERVIEHGHPNVNANKMYLNLSNLVIFTSDGGIGLTVFAGLEN